MTPEPQAPPDTAPMLPELQRAADSAQLTEEVAASYDPVGIGAFFDKACPGKRRSATLADGTVITAG